MMMMRGLLSTDQHKLPMILSIWHDIMSLTICEQWSTTLRELEDFTARPATAAAAPFYFEPSLRAHTHAVAMELRGRVLRAMELSRCGVREGVV